MKLFLSTLFCFLVVHSLTADPRGIAADVTGFVENRGQWPSDVRFRLQLPGLDCWITDRGAVYDLYDQGETAIPHSLLFAGVRSPLPLDERATPCARRPSSLFRRGHVVRAEFTRTSADVVVRGEGRVDPIVNYFIGSDTSRWRSDCRIFSTVRLKGIYDKIDLLYYLDDGLPRYDIIAEPGADLSQIRLQMSGADSLIVTSDGHLSMETSLGSLDMRELLTYQRNERGERCQVRSRFAVEGKSVRFDVGPVDPTRPVVIDPLIFSTYIGSLGTPYPFSRKNARVAVDGLGNVYVAANVYDDRDYPTTVGAYDTVVNGASDIVVTKLSANGSALKFSTYIGGENEDIITALIVGDDGAPLIAGDAQAGYPTTTGAYGRTVKGEHDIFVTKLNASGKSLQFSTLIGGTGSDHCAGIALNERGVIYITGSTRGSGYPTTPDAYLGARRGGEDVVVTLLNAEGTSLTYSTLLGGDGYDYAVDLFYEESTLWVVGAADDVHLSQQTPFPTTVGAHHGGSDIFAARFGHDGHLQMCALIGTRENESPSGMTRSPNGIGIIGTIYTDDPFVTTEGSFSPERIGKQDIYVMDVDWGGSIIYSTYLGGSSDDFAYDVASTRDSLICVVGITHHDTGAASIPFPTTDGAISTTPRTNDAFIALISADGSALHYSTLLGGAGKDAAFAVAVDEANNILVVGATGAAASPEENYPTTDGAYRTVHGGEFELFVSKIAIDLSEVDGGEWIPFPRLDLR